MLKSRNVFGGEAVAVMTRLSTSAMSASASAIDVGCDRSSGRPRARPPSSVATLFACSADRLVTITSSPRSTNRSAMNLPSPRLPPIITDVVIACTSASSRLPARLPVYGTYRATLELTGGRRDRRRFQFLRTGYRCAAGRFPLLSSRPPAQHDRNGDAEMRRPTALLLVVMT